MSEKIEICSEHQVHTDKVKEIKDKMPKDDKLYDLAELYKMFSDPTRLKILSALQITEACVCDIAEALSMSQSAISHQLRLLKQAELVKCRKEGKAVFYSLTEGLSDIF